MPLALLALALAACGASEEAVSTQPQSSASGGGLTKLSAQDLADFDVANTRVQADLDALVPCISAGNSDCINVKGHLLEEHLRAAEDTLSSIGPETRDNECYRRLLEYDTLLKALDAASEPVFAAAEAGQAAALRGLASEATQLQEDHGDLSARILANCA